MQKLVVPLLVVLFLGVTVIVTAQDKDGEKPKYTIKEVMKKAMKGPLLKKVAGGKGTKKDAETLVVMFESMGKQKPPKGDLKSWKKKCDGLVKAAKDAVANKKGAGAALSKAAKCAACHKPHKK